MLFPGYNVWHSPGSNWHKMDECPEPWVGAVEVFAGPEWLEENYPGSIYIYNYRSLDTWLQSCASVWHKAQKLNWNNPLWKYPMSQFEDYYWRHNHTWLDSSVRLGRRYFEVDLIKEPNWVKLCAGLHIDKLPEWPFPKVDNHGNRALKLANPFVNNRADAFFEE
jgi:hypothetical protein